MKTITSISLLTLLTFTASIYAFAADDNNYNEKYAVTTNIQIQSERGKGSHFRSKYNALLTMIKAKQLDAAAISVVELRKEFEGIFDEKLKPLVFQSRVEFDDFTKKNPNTFEWIDASYGETLQMQGFIATELKKLPEALEISKKIESIAPTSAGNAAETGYLLTLMGMPEQGLAAYRRAYNLSTKYASQNPYRASSLRGIGSSLIDLNELDKAERAFLASLEIEPGNEIAINEISLIRQKIKKK